MDIREVNKKLIKQLVGIRRQAAKARSDRGNAMAVLADIDDTTSLLLEEVLMGMSNWIIE